MRTNKSINTHCPWSGNPVSKDALTSYLGVTVGFCNTGCKDKFDQAIRMFDNCIGEVSGGSLKRNFIRHAKYNAWINKKLFDLIAKLTVEDINKDGGAFFGSIIGTLNHILVWDTLWLQRFASQYIEYKTLIPVIKLHSPTHNDEILYADLGELLVARTAMDVVIVNFINETSEHDYNSIFSYNRMSGETYNKYFGGVIQHVFNHQTHHRGQVTTLLFQMGIDPGVTDLLTILEEKYNE